MSLWLPGFQLAWFLLRLVLMLMLQLLPLLLLLMPCVVPLFLLFLVLLLLVVRSLCRIAYPAALDAYSAKDAVLC